MHRPPSTRRIRSVSVFAHCLCRLPTATVFALASRTRQEQIAAKMKILKPLCFLMLTYCLSLLLLSGCSAIKSELASPAGTTNAPPLSTQLNAASTVANEVVPQPWGAIISSALALAGSAAAAYAAKHANAASQSSAAAAASAAVSMAASPAPATPAPAPSPVTAK